MTNMTNLYIPICGFFIALFLIVCFFMKERIKNVETTIFSGMLITSFIDSILMILIIYIAYVMPQCINLLKILNKIDYLQFLIWIWLFFLYVMHISYNDNKRVYKHFNKITIISTILNIISYIVMLILPVKLYNENNIMYSYGPSCDALYVFAVIYILLIIVTLIRNFRKILRKKYVPVYIFVILELLVLAIKNVNPGLVIITAIIAYVNLIMYNTIENPDIKMKRQLEVAKDQADKANRAKTDFLSSMSHEIRTPLNAIVGFSDYIMSAETLDEAKENAQDIVNASNTLLEIVNGILDISKIEAGKLEIVNSKYNARQTFEALAKLITPKMKEKGLDFTYYIAPDLPDTLFGDHANLKKIVTNLLSNAYKYTEKGSVRYEVNCINSNNISKLIITVEDTGRGIKQESIDKLFTKFQRLDEDKNTTIEGTGLGLAITKQLIELMGGKILVHTVYGEGSKFTVVLNQHIEKTEIVEEKVEIKTTLDLKNKKILLVDDNSLNIKVANKILERFNANNITSLDNGFDCIDLIQSGAVFDIILMDDMMPKMSGVETFKKLREIEGFNQPVVILTANAITGMKEKYLKEGFEDYLAKPIEKDELIRVCNTIFQKYQSNQPEPPEETTKVEESNQKDKVENIEEVQLIEPIKPIEEIEELEIIGEDEPPVQTKETYLKENGVDLDKSLELLGDIEMYNMTLNDFLSEVEDKWNNIVTYKNNSDMENYAIEVHSLKSDAKYLGFMSLADISYQHELKSKENDINFILEHFTELEIEYNKALAIAKTYIKM